MEIIAEIRGNTEYNYEGNPGTLVERCFNILPLPFCEDFVRREDENTNPRKGLRDVHGTAAAEEEKLKSLRDVYARNCRNGEKKLLGLPYLGDISDQGSIQPGDPEAPYKYLNDSVKVSSVIAPASGYEIPITVYEAGTERGFVMVYYHGGGLKMGESDSEGISCRLLANHAKCAVYSVGYRLLYKHKAQTCVQDAIDAYKWVMESNPGKKVLLVGVSSGGQLAAMVSQAADKAELRGVILRNPVIIDSEHLGTNISADRQDFLRYIRGRYAEKLFPLYKSLGYVSRDTDTIWNIPGYLKRHEPRDGLEEMPGEAKPSALKGLPRTWIQVCTNDPLVGDGVYYAHLLQSARVEVKVDVWEGFPHAFFHLYQEHKLSRDAERGSLLGLDWILQH